MKKSIVISLLTIATLFCTALCSFASTGKVTTDTLRLRKEASTDSSTIALLSVNDEIEILGEEEGWYKVKSGENVGYVATQYISVLTNTNPNASDVSKDTNIVENSNTQNNSDENTETNKSEEKNSEKKTVLEKEQKIYITPIINSLIIETLEEEKEVEIISEINGWSYIKIDTTSGWVRTENIQTKEVEKTTSEPENNNNTSSTQKIGYISESSVNFRKTPSTSADIISKLEKNAKVTIINEGESWSEIEYNGNRGYVSNTYISDTEIKATTRSSGARKVSNTSKKEETTTKVENTSTKSVSNETKSSGKVTGAEVVSYAKQYLGSKYVYGGSSPSGFDCSGFTTYVYKHFGISLSRSSSAQASNGRAVDRNNLAVGDIVCFSSSSKSTKIGHVGIYIGGNRFIHAANSRKGVITSKMSGDGYYFVTARRVI